MIQSFSPTEPSDRIVLLDALRGFAILGILLVNYYAFAWPMEWSAIGVYESASVLDDAAMVFVDFFARTKFYTLFSFLFGVGLAMQRERCLASGREFSFFGPSRMFVLFWIGLAHGIFIWFGDILAIYAVFGMILCVFLGLRPVYLLTLSVVSLLIYLLVLFLFSFVPDIAEPSAAQIEDYQDAVALILTGGYWEIVGDRVIDLLTVFLSLILMGWLLFGVFALGAAVWKFGWLKRIHEYPTVCRRVLIAALVLGLPANIIYTWARYEQPHMGFDGIFLLEFMVGLVAQLAFLAIFVTVFSLFRGAWQDWLAPVGKMALTNYLAQSLVFTMIFYGYGLGLTARVSPATGLVLCFGFFVVQVYLSKLWSTRFRMGPVEWFWRKTTYGLYGLLSKL